MDALPSYLIAASALVILALGCLHLLLTFRGNRLHPRESGLMERMQNSNPVITRETTMWKAWIGFNASHSYGAMLFGLSFVYLALWHGELLFSSVYLLGLGLLFLGGYVFLGKRYWFSRPNAGILLATGLYVAALVLSQLS